MCGWYTSACAWVPSLNHLKMLVTTKNERCPMVVPAPSLVGPHLKNKRLLFSTAFKGLDTRLVCKYSDNALARVHTEEQQRLVLLCCQMDYDYDILKICHPSRRE